MPVDVECDLLVVGSGAGGLSAAVTAASQGLKVIVAEKEPVFGGAAAWSGGWMWTPCNALARRAGIVEDKEAPLAYLRHVLGNNFNAAKVNAILDAAPRMVSFFEEKTAIQFEPGLKIPDTYGDAPGAGTVDRSRKNPSHPHHQVELKSVRSVRDVRQSGDWRSCAEASLPC